MAEKNSENKSGASTGRPFVPGQSGNPSGRPSGVPNKATTRAREAIARLVDDNSERLQGWLDQIAETEGPLAAWKCVMDVVEYHIPKLQRTELSGPDGGPMQHQATLAPADAYLKLVRGE